MDKLKPCPFCGNSHVEHGSTYGDVPFCCHCGAKGPSYTTLGIDKIKESQKKAVEAWNTRKDLNG